MLTLYHNPRCSKSREALELLRSKGIEPKIIEYLKTPPTAKELEEILQKLELEPEAIIRTKEKIYEELGLKNKKLNRAEMIEILAKYPILIERPILIHGSRGVVGRPVERVLGIL